MPIRGLVTTAALLNREVLGASRSITVRATSTDGSTADTVFTIHINDLDEFDTTATVDANASANSVVENAANGLRWALWRAPQMATRLPTQSLIRWMTMRVTVHDRCQYGRGVCA